MSPIALGVKQEVYAHVLLINIARIFESEANKQLSPPSFHAGEEKNTEIKDHHWQGLFDKIQKLKINFKNCLLVISRVIEKLIISLEKKKESWLSRILSSISRVRQKIRPGRHFPRSSNKIYTKWRSSNA